MKLRVKILAARFQVALSADSAIRGGDEKASKLMALAILSCWFNVESCEEDYVVEDASYQGLFRVDMCVGYPLNV